MSRTAIYPGSFDPPTLAHQEILRQAKEVFDRVVVVIGRNVGKGQPMYSPAERTQMWVDMGVSTDIFAAEGGDVVEWASSGWIQAAHVVRGIRGPEDLPGERAYRRFLCQQSHGAIDAVYFMTPPDLSDVSSTAVRQILALKDKTALTGWVDSRIVDRLL